MSLPNTHVTLCFRAAVDFLVDGQFLLTAPSRMRESSRDTGLVPRSRRGTGQASADGREQQASRGPGAHASGRFTRPQAPVTHPPSTTVREKHRHRLVMALSSSRVKIGIERRHPEVVPRAAELCPAPARCTEVSRAPKKPT